MIEQAAALQIRHVSATCDRPSGRRSQAVDRRIAERPGRLAGSRTRNRSTTAALRQQMAARGVNVSGRQHPRPPRQPLLRLRSPPPPPPRPRATSTRALPPVADVDAMLPQPVEPTSMPVAAQPLMVATSHGTALWRLPAPGDARTPCRWPCLRATSNAGLRRAVAPRKPCPWLVTGRPPLRKLFRCMAWCANGTSFAGLRRAGLRGACRRSAGIRSTHGHVASGRRSVASPESAEPLGMVSTAVPRANRYRKQSNAGPIFVGVVADWPWRSGPAGFW